MFYNGQFELCIGDNDLEMMHRKRQYTVITMTPSKNGLDKYMINGPFYFELLEKGIEQDWKTRIARNIKDIPKGTKLICNSLLYNFYGLYIQAEYKGRTYSLDPKICKYKDLKYSPQEENE